MRTYGHQALRGLGATLFLGLFGTTAALIPIAIFSLIANGEPAPWTLYAAAAVIGGAAIGWILQR
jgi:predicted membrane-bound spermidine synthase